ncbi:MAG: hypothetical protein RLZZ458_1132 [Planctomycetota bacterium]
MGWAWGWAWDSGPGGELPVIGHAATFADDNDAVADDDGDIGYIAVWRGCVCGDDAGITADADIFVKQGAIDVGTITDAPDL